MICTLGPHFQPASPRGVLTLLQIHVLPPLGRPDLRAKAQERRGPVPAARHVLPAAAAVPPD